MARAIHPLAISKSGPLLDWARRAWALLFAVPKMPAPMSAQQSRAIAVARVLCILGVIYVHAWHGRTTAYIVTHSDTPQGMMRWFFVEMIGRNSVPLLGMISGWLVAATLLRHSYWHFLSGKARTILAPLILWNALAVLVIAAAIQIGLIRGPAIGSGWWLFQELTSFTEHSDINVQAPFLRDLFVCMGMAPLFVWMRSRTLATLIGIVAIWSIGGWWFPLFLRPLVPFCFLLGIMARRGGWAERIMDMPFAYAALPFAVLGPVKFALSVWGFHFGLANPEIVATLELMMRVAAALLSWRTAIALAESVWAPVIMRFEPYVFMLFCAHMIFIWLGGLPIGQHIGPLDTPLYPVFFLAQPFLILGVTMLLARLLVELWPGAAALLSGGRLRIEPDRSAALTTA